MQPFPKPHSDNPVSTMEPSDSPEYFFLLFTGHTTFLPSRSLARVPGAIMMMAIQKARELGKGKIIVAVA